MSNPYLTSAFPPALRGAVAASIKENQKTQSPDLCMPTPANKSCTAYSNENMQSKKCSKQMLPDKCK